MYKLDRTAFRMQTFEEADDERSYWLSKSPMERLEAAWYLTCKAYGLDEKVEHRLQKNIFSKKRL